MSYQCLSNKNYPFYLNRQKPYSHQAVRRFSPKPPRHSPEIVRHNRKLEYSFPAKSFFTHLLRTFIIGLLMLWSISWWWNNSNAFYEPLEEHSKHHQWLTLTVGDSPTWSQIFAQLPMPPELIEKSLPKLVPQQKLYVKYDHDGHFKKLIVPLGAEELHLYLDNKILKKQLQFRQEKPVFVHGEVRTSLEAAARQAGLSDSLLAELIKIFRWEGDFLRHAQVGDQFGVLYEQYSLDGESHEGAILAAEFSHRGKVYRAVRYTDPQGVSDYYSPTGERLRKTFLLTPVDFTKVSSVFGSRWHPIFHRWRFHKGLDYVAPIGTPVTAAGEAKVRFIGYKGGYGKTVILEHSDHYTTLYAHLSKFAKGLQVGQLVRPEEVIGYVGQTGFATAPHLHYEFYVDGLQQNPFQANFPLSLPIAEAYQADFLQTTRPFITQLETLSQHPPPDLALSP